MLLYHSHSCRTRPITFAQWWQHGGCCSRISRCSVATMPRHEVKREWNLAHEYSLLIAAQVICVVVHAQIQSMSSILGIGLLLLLLLWQTDIHAMHWIAPTSSSCKRCLDSWQACD